MMQMLLILVFLILMPISAFGLPTISGLTENSDPVNAYEKFELDFDIGGLVLASNYYEMYDPTVPGGAEGGAGVTVTCTFTDPDLTTYDVPGFYYRDMDVSGTFPNFHLTEKLVDDSWKVRFSPHKVGSWSYSISVTSLDGVIATPSTGTFTVRAPIKKGFIQKASNNRYFSFSGTGEVFIPIGPVDLDDDVYSDGLNTIRPWMAGQGAYSTLWTKLARIDKQLGNEGIRMSHLNFSDPDTDMDLAWKIQVPSYATGTHTGANDAAVLTNSSASWTVDAMINLYISNDTDGSGGWITDNTATTITVTLSGGDNDWDTGDTYTITDACSMVTGSWSEYAGSVYYADFSNLHADSDDDEYQLTITYKIVSMGSAVDGGQDYGFTIKNHDYAILDADSPCDYSQSPATAEEYYEYIRSSDTLGEGGVNSGFGHKTSSTGYDTVQITFDYEDGADYGDYLSFYLDNCSYGEVLISSISIKADPDDDGTYDQELMFYTSADVHRTINQKPAYYFDEYLEYAEDNGVYIKWVVYDKNDWIPDHLDESTGAFVVSGDGYHQDIDTSRAKWHLKNWYRYCVARWGYSPNVFGFEYCNEHTPNYVADGAYDAAGDFATYMKSVDPDVNTHLYSTSSWQVGSWREGHEQTGYNANTDLDHGDIHDYPDGNTDNRDIYSYFKTFSDDVASYPISRPVTFSEIGIDEGGGTHNTWLEANSHDGVFYRNIVWFNAVSPSPLWLGMWWYPEQLDFDNDGTNDDHTALADAVDAYTSENYFLHNGTYADISATDPTGIDTVGQKDVSVGKAYFRIKNEEYNWCQNEEADFDGDGTADCSAITPRTGDVTFTMTGHNDTLFLLETWDEEAGTKTVSKEVSSGSGVVTISLSSFSEASTYKLYLPEWLTLGNGNDRPYYVPYDYETASGPALNLKCRRFFGARVELFAEPVTYLGVTYIGFMNGKLYAVDVTDCTNASGFNSGDPYTVGGPITKAAALGHDSSGNMRIVVVDLSGLVSCLSLSGTLAWSVQLDAPIHASPLIQENAVYIGDMDGYLYRLNMDNGEIEFTYDSVTDASGGPITGDFAFGDDALFFQTVNNVAIALEKDGTERWTNQMNGVFTTDARAVYVESGGVKTVVFQTRLPGSDYGGQRHDIPAAFSVENTDFDTVVIPEWADYYDPNTDGYDERRPSYFYNAITGADRYDPDAEIWVPLNMPYWACHNFVVDKDNETLYGVITGGYQSGLFHDHRLVSLNPITGVYTEEDYQLVADKRFMLRYDEIGQLTIANDTIYQNTAEEYGYTTTSGGNYVHLYGSAGDHRKPDGIDDDPIEVYSGDHKHWIAYGGHTDAGQFGHTHSTIVGDDMIDTIWGYLYIMTHESGTPSHIHDTLDPNRVAPAVTTTRSEFITELERRCQAVVDGGTMDPVAFNSWDAEAPGDEFARVLWDHADVVIALSNALDYITDGTLITDLKSYLSTYVDTYLLTSTYYAYSNNCVNYDIDDYETSCTGTIATDWWGSNRNYTMKRIYALYVYAEKTDDYAKVTGATNWAFIEARYADFSGRWDTDYLVFHVDTASDGSDWNWLNGVWAAWPHQLQAMYGLWRIAVEAGDGDATTYLARYNSIVDGLQDGNDSSITVNATSYDGWVNYIRDQYPNVDENDDLFIPCEDELGDEDADCDYYDAWGFSQIAPIPSSGGWTNTNDYRLPFNLDDNDFADERAIYGNTDNVKPYKLVGFSNMTEEVASVYSGDAELEDVLDEYIASIEKTDWYSWMGMYGTQIQPGTHEHMRLSYWLASDIFRNKIYVKGETFEDMRAYVPWEHGIYQDRDIMRIQNLNALLSASYTEETVKSLMILK